MGQIIRLPASLAPYPNTSAGLDTAETVLLTAVRWWVSAYRRGENTLKHLRLHFEALGAYEAAFSVDTLMAVVARTLRRPMAVHCPCCPNLSDDEKHLLHAASLAQAGDGALARTVLHNTLLSAQGADFALLTLEGLGQLFAGARLLLQSRLPQPVVRDASGRAGACPDASSETRH